MSSSYTTTPTQSLPSSSGGPTAATAAATVAGAPIPIAAAKPAVGVAGLGGFYTVHVLAAFFPVLVASAVYGWRALGTIGLVLASAAFATYCWRRIGMRGPTLHYSHVLWLSLLLSLILPAHLLSDGVPGVFTLPAYAWTI